MRMNSKRYPQLFSAAILLAFSMHLYGFDSAGISYITAQPDSSTSNYLLASGVTQLFCYHTTNDISSISDESMITSPPNTPGAYNGWYMAYNNNTSIVGNCTSPAFTDANNNSVTCKSGYYPVAHVSVVQTDGCTTPTGGLNTLYMTIIEPANGYIGRYGQSWFLCFMEAYNILSNTKASSLVASYSIYCTPCPSGDCSSLQPSSGCPPYSNGSLGPNNGVFPRNAKGVATGWCNDTGSGGIN